jgi:ABC-type methionine transport system permease subunit
MAAFGAGTLPLRSTVALGLRRATPASLAARRVLAVTVLAVGLWSIAARSGLIGAGGHGVPAAHHVPH